MAVDLPFPFTAKTPEEMIKQSLRLFEDLYQERVGGAQLGDVFAIGDDEVLSLSLSTTGGLQKVSSRLAIKGKSTGGISSDSNGIYVVCKPGGGLATDATGLYYLSTIPHMMQSNSTDQAIANVANAQVITFDTDVHHQEITRTSNSRFTITKAGSYLITFSGVALCGTAGKRIEVWLKKNTAYVDNSNTVYTFKAANANTVIACSYIEHFAVGDYFEFWTWGDDTGAKWDATAAAVGPVRPACPSVIITCNYLSAD